MLTPTRLNTTPFKALKDLSNSGNENSLLSGEDIDMELEYTNALKELQKLRYQVKSHKDKEEELEREFSLLENYNAKVEMMELNIKNLQVNLQEYSSLLKKWEKFGMFVGIPLMVFVLYFLFRAFLDNI